MWWWLAVVGVTALSAHYCMVRAFALTDAIVVVTLDFVRLPLIALVGFVFYDENIEWFVFLGAALIFSGNLVNIRAEQERERRGTGSGEPAPAPAPPPTAGRSH